VSYASVVGSEGDRPISLIEVRSISHEKYPFDPGQRSSQRGTWPFEVPGMDIDMVTEKGSGPLRVADENGRACSRINEALSYPRADVSRGADDEVFHLSITGPSPSRTILATRSKSSLRNRTPNLARPQCAATCASLTAGGVIQRQRAVVSLETR
jgi:hypothetical protein